MSDSKFNTALMTQTCSLFCITKNISLGFGIVEIAYNSICPWFLAD